MSEVSVYIDAITECIISRTSKKPRATKLRRLHISEAKAATLIKSGWNFDWNIPETNGYEIYSLKADGDNRIQGLIAFKIIESERYIHVDIAEAAPFNVGKNGEYKGVGANLFAYACKKSWDLGFEGYVQFIAKNDLIDHYEKTLGAKLISSQNMYIGPYEALKLIRKYFVKEEK